MKTNYILLAVSLLFCTLFTSCSKEEDAPFSYYYPTSSKVTTTFDGNEMVFDRATVTKEAYDGYNDILIIATMKGDPTKSLRLEMTEYLTGTEACYYFAYNNGERDFDTENTDHVLNVDVTHNSAGTVRGTFSGVLSDFENNTMQVSTGRFDIRY